MNKQLIFQLILIIVIIIPVYCITISESNTKNVTLIPEDVEENLNRTERTRRLIPYMTYYIPSSNQYEHLAPSQVYTIMSLNNNKQQYQDQYEEERPVKQNQPKTEYVTNYNNRYQQQSPNYRQTIVYTTKHQSQKQPQNVEPQNINQYQTSPSPTKVSLTPFLSSNKAPGPFRPMYYEKEEEEEREEEEPQQRYEYRTVTTKPQNQEVRSTQRPYYAEQVIKYISAPGNQETKYFVEHLNYDQDRPKYTIPQILPHGNTKYVLQNPNIKYITHPQQPQYEDEVVQHKYVNQNENKKFIPQLEPVQKYIPEPTKYQNQAPVQNFIAYITPSSTTKPPPQQKQQPQRQYEPQYIYREQYPQKIYEVKPSQPPRHSQKTPNYSNANSNTNTYSQQQPDQIEYIVQKQVPYYAPRPVSVSPVPKHQPYTDQYNHMLTTTLAPVININTVTPTYHTTYHRNHKYANVAKPQYKSSTSAPIQHLTEVTSSQQDSKSYFYQSAGPIAVKQMPKYQPIFKPSPPPKILITTVKPAKYEPNTLADILKKLQESNHLPHTLTPDNIDNSIKTLVKILNDLKKSQKVVDSPPQNHFQESDGDEDEYYDTDPVKTIDDDNLPGPNTGRPGIDYPALAEIPQTSFNCKDQRYKGFFGDPETNCQVWHYCDLNGGQASFLCPNGTIFSQVALTCDWWFNVKCSSTAQLYVLNERLYKYILPFTPKFPEDYSGPLVDKYLALKFEEMEEKMRKQKKGKGDNEPSEDQISDADNNKNDEEPIEEDKIDEGEDEDNVQPEYTMVTETIPAPPLIEPKIKIPPVTPTRTTVESEKVEVIEIKSDGSSGHLIPGKN